MVQVLCSKKEALLKSLLGDLGVHTRAWCNGSIRVSKTFDLGSNPSARAYQAEIVFSRCLKEEYFFRKPYNDEQGRIYKFVI